MFGFILGTKKFHFSIQNTSNSELNAKYSFNNVNMITFLQLNFKGYYNQIYINNNKSSFKIQFVQKLIFVSGSVSKSF